MNELLERYKLAMQNWPRPLDEEAVNSALMDHVRAIGGKQHRAVRLLSTHMAHHVDGRAATTIITDAIDRIDPNG